MIRKKDKYRLVAAVAAVLLCTTNVSAQPVFPGAVGFGTQTPAGRGGKIIRVTNLNDSGPGSLRECVTTSGPRYCVFEVSGIITLERNLVVTQPNVTIAGQTAPAPGIMLRGHALKISASDVVVRHIASRTGAENDGTDPSLKEPLIINGGDKLIRNIVIDHCSISWAVDENISSYANWDNVTISNTIVSEPLYDSEHRKGPHSMSVLLDTQNENSSASMIGNLIAHSNGRNPRVMAADFVFVNNVVYNAGNFTMMLYNRHDIRSDNTIANNVFIEGPDSGPTPAVLLTGPNDGAGWNSILPGTRIYLANNFDDDATKDPWSIVLNKSTVSRSELEVLAPLSLLSIADAAMTEREAILDRVLENAGTRPGDRNEVDRRVIDDVRNGTGRIINCVAPDGSTRCQKNAGGWPDLARNTRRLALPADPDGDKDADGYTNVEEWLHEMAAAIEGGSSAPAPDPTPPSPPLPPELQP